MTSNSELRRLFAVTLATLVLSACATTIKSDVDIADDGNYHEFKTYAWLTDQFTNAQAMPSIDGLNPVNERRVRAAVETELARKGYQKATRDEPDFVVSFRLVVTDSLQVREVHDGYGYDYSDYYPGLRRSSDTVRRGSGATGFSVQTMTEANLVVDIFDNASKEAIWQGSTRNRLARADARADTRELIDQSVASVLALFPDEDQNQRRRTEAPGAIAC